MKLLLLSLLCLSISAVTVEEEFSNVALMLGNDALKKTSTPRSAFRIVRHDCIADPSSTMTLQMLSYNRDDYLNYLKSVNGSQFYVGDNKPDNFHSFQFSVDNQNYWCGYREEECGDFVMYFRCMLLIFE